MDIYHLLNSRAQQFIRSVHNTYTHTHTHKMPTHPIAKKIYPFLFLFSGSQLGVILAPSPP